MNPISTPGLACGDPSSGYGVLSKVTFTGPVSLVACPARPLARQNGWLYRHWTLIVLPCGMRWVSWSRSPPSPDSAASVGSYTRRPASVGGIATIACLALTSNPSRSEEHTSELQSRGHL